MINPCPALLLIFCLGISMQTAQAQHQSFTLQEIRMLAAENYPLIKQRDLIAQSATYSTEQANTGHLPQINIYGQVTYQSAVTEIPIRVSGMDVPMLSKDQYKLYGEINQNLYDGGAISLQKQAIDANASMEEQALHVELYRIKERVNQLFFGILLLNAQLAQKDLLQKEIQAGLEKTRSAIANGAALKSSGSLLEAEALKVEQQTTELRATRKGYLHMLGLFIGQPLTEETVLEKPMPVTASSAINRPELGWYAQQQHSIDVERKLLTAQNLPKLGLFLQVGAGRPALNMLSNDFETYYYGGVRLTIPISGFYTLKKERAILAVRKAVIDIQQETFLFNTRLSLQQQNTETAKYQQMLETDDEIIALQTSVKDAAFAQLENGVINTADYLRDVYAEDQAKLTKIYHELQLLKAQYDIQYTTGN